MDPTMMGIAIFFLLFIITTGAFALMLPLARQFAKYLDYRMQDRGRAGEISSEQIAQIKAMVEDLEKKLRGVSDRQDFLEKLLEARDVEPPKLPR